MHHSTIILLFGAKNDFLASVGHKHAVATHASPRSVESDHLGPVQTNPFSNENGAVLLRFQNDLRPHYNAVSVLKTLIFIPSV